MKNFRGEKLTTKAVDKQPEEEHQEDCKMDDENESINLDDVDLNSN